MYRILGSLVSAYLKLESCNLDHISSWNIQTPANDYNTSKFGGFSLLHSGNTKPKIRWRHLFGDLTIYNLCCYPSSGGQLLPEVGARNIFWSSQSQFHNLKEERPQSQFCNYLRNAAPQPQFHNSAIAIFSEVRNFISVTWEFHFRYFRHIFGRGVAWNYIFLPQVFLAITRIIKGQ
jgi:hypothetical protein